jgi:hypothetical protein
MGTPFAGFAGSLWAGFLNFEGIFRYSPGGAYLFPAAHFAVFSLLRRRHPSPFCAGLASPDAVQGVPVAGVPLHERDECPV